MNDVLVRALEYAADGIPVFPCGANKRPLTPHGFKDASTDANQIRRWWSTHPDASIGMPTGSKSGIAVLDLDVKNGKDGLARVPDWKSRSTVIARTQSGGVHLYFTAVAAPGCASDKIAPGVDTRGDGGYVIAPGSPGYEWIGESRDLKNLPPWPSDLQVSEHRPALPWLTRVLSAESVAKLARVAGKGLSTRPEDLPEPVDPEEITAALAVVPSDDYGMWLEGGSAVCSALGEEKGKPVFEWWSAKSAKYDPRECDKKWPECAKLAHAYTASTIYWLADQHDPTWRERFESSRAASADKRYSIVRASDVVPRPKHWLWTGHLLRGALELLTGVPGVGKSQLQIDLVARATTGKPWPDGTPNGQPVAVVMVTAEDALDYEVVPRLMAADADLHRVHILKTIRKDNRDRMFLLDEDIAVMAQIVDDIGGVGLVTLDPITAYMGKVDSHRATDVRGQLAPLSAFAEAKGVAVSAITHPPKAASQKAIDHFIGSQAFIAAARVGHLCVAELGEDETPTGRVLFTNAKNNSHLRMPTLAYRIVQTTVGQDEATREVIVAPRVQWIEGTVNVTADQAIAPKGKDDGGARKLLEELLAADGRVPVKTVEDNAKARGLTMRQMHYAKDKMCVVPVKDGLDGGWVWVSKGSELL